MRESSFRVYIVRHGDDRLTGHLMPRWAGFLSPPAPAAYGVNEEDILARLDAPARALRDSRDDTISRYLWKEEFETRSVRLEIHPQSSIKKQLVIGKKTVPLTMTYAWSRLSQGGFRVLLPRFGWSWILEELSMAADVLRQEIQGALSGAEQHWLFDYRRQGEETVHEWKPAWLSDQDEDDDDWDDEEFETLHQVAEELVEKAVRRRLPPFVGDLDVTHLMPYLDRYPPMSLLIVGPSGVGKTAWVQRLAQLFGRWRRDDDRPDIRIWSTSGDRILAGQVYLGMWEKRCMELVQELSWEGDYLYIDRLTGLLEERGGRTTIGEFLMPAVADGEISLIAECTEAELESCRRRSPSWVSLFHVVRLEETPPRAMPELMRGYLSKRRGGRRGKAAGEIRIHPQGLRRLTELLATFERHQAFPGKAFRFLDRLIQEQGKEARTLDPSSVVRAFSKATGLPEELISDEHAAGEEVITGRLQAGVIGQDAACRAGARILARFKAGLNDPERPCGSLLFVGPTGVGKTELAKQLARYLFSSPDRMLRFDMSEYMLPGSAERLLATGPGVESLAVGLRRQPLSLILFDEVEKAHPEVFDLLLGLLGEGRISDARGRLVDGRMAFCVMTSNLGVARNAAPGFGAEAAPEEAFRTAVRKHFRPEFWNRLDEVVPFRNLSREDVERIVDLELAKASEREGLRRRRIRLDMDSAARKHLAELGWHPSRGARPLKRVLEERVMTPLAVRLAASPEIKDRTYRILSEGEPADDVLLIES